jgi:hypothetical protein
MIGNLLLRVSAIAAPAFAAASAWAAAPGAGERAVLAVDQKWADAESRGDIAAVRPILDDRFLATFDASRPLDKPTFLKVVFANDAGEREIQTLSDRTAVLAGSTAVVLETDTIASTNGGQTTRHVYRITVTYALRRAHWVALAEHIVTAPGG